MDLITEEILAIVKDAGGVEQSQQTFEDLGQDSPDSCVIGIRVPNNVRRSWHGIRALKRIRKTPIEAADGGNDSAGSRSFLKAPQESNWPPDEFLGLRLANLLLRSLTLTPD